MKKFVLVLILGALLTVNVLGQANLSFDYKGVTYYYSQLPVTTLDALSEDYVVLEVDANGNEYVVEDDDGIWIIEYE